MNSLQKAVRYPVLDSDIQRLTANRMRELLEVRKVIEKTHPQHRVVAMANNTLFKQNVKRPH